MNEPNWKTEGLTRRMLTEARDFHHDLDDWLTRLDAVRHPSEEATLALIAFHLRKSLTLIENPEEYRR